MSYQIRYLGLVLLIGLSTLSHSQLWAQDKIEGKIAVLQILNQSNLKSEEISFLTNEIQSQVQLKTRGYYQVMTQENILQLLPPDKKLEDCIGECEVETGRLLGAKLLITGQLVKFGSEKDNLRLSLKLHETDNGTLISSATIKGSSANDIEEKLNQATESLITDGLKGLKSKKIEEKLIKTSETKSNDSNLDDLSQKLEQLNQLEQKEDTTALGVKVDYESELKVLEAEKQKKEDHQKQVETQWQKVLVVVQNKKVSVGKQAVQLFMNEYNQHLLGNPRMKDAVNLLDELTKKEEEEKENTLRQSHLAKVRISYEATKSFMVNGDEKGKQALDLFLEEFENHPLGNPLKDEALAFYEEKRREREETERVRHLKTVEVDWAKVKKIVEVGDEKGKKALELFLKKYEGHAMGNPLREEALAFFEAKRSERESRLKAEHLKTVEDEWERIRKVVGVGGAIAVRTVELFLKKYEGHALGNPLEEEAREVLADLKEGRELGDVAGGGGKGKAGITWVRIKGGSFMMGSEDGYDDEKPVHRVKVRDFYMSKTEVTVGQYRKCVEAGGCSEHHWDDGRCYVYDGPDWEQGILGKEFRGENQPIVCVDWMQARRFAKWVGGDLPSEAQWEYASRSGGRDIKYPWGNAAATCKYAVMDDGGYGCGKDRTWEVCSKTGGNTVQGLCDMGGNVWEWVLDVRHVSYIGAPSNDISWGDRAGGSNDPAYRFHRGGSWRNFASYLRSAYRSDYSAPHLRSDLGFRVSKSVP